MDCIVQPQNTLWTGAFPHGLPTYHQRNFFPNFCFPRKRSYNSPFYSGPGLFFPHDDEVDYPTDMKGELTSATIPYHGMVDEIGEVKLCVVCGERASGFYFGALVCLPCKSFYIRCTKDGEPTFTCQCSGNCDIIKQGRIRCQYCRYQRCLMAGMCRKEKPETVQPAEGQVLCKVCGDIANGIHFGVNTCEGCKKFFRRGLVENQSYICKGEKDCAINPRNRNNCRYCRYQKCISVGMSREAIKMGRPKKGDGSDVSNVTSSPKVTRMPLLEVDSMNQSTSTNPQLGDDNCDSLKTSSVQDKIKEEDVRSSCDYGKKTGSMWNQNNGNHTSSWQQPCNQGQGQSIPHSTPSTNGISSSEFIEEEMDEILMMLQNDNQTGSPNKKMRCYHYGDMSSQKVCKTEYDPSMSAGQQWNMNDLPSSMSNNIQHINEPMNMSSSHMNQMVNRPPPPQYPGYTDNNYQQQDQSLCMPASPCHSTSSQIPSPRSYMSDSSMHSPGYIPNGSPVHSPCQYSPKHSPMYPQSPYQSDISSQGSPFSEPLYNSQPYSPQDSYQVTDLSSRSPSSYNNTMTQLSNTSSSMTIPHQEGGVNSHDNWCLTGSPSFYCHSPSNNTNLMTIPNQEGTYRRSASRKENLQRINNYFLSRSSCDLQLVTDTDLDGSMTRSDIEEEVVNKTLSSVSPAESFYYVMSDHQSSSNSDSNCSSNYDEFTSCQRINKRKMCDTTDSYRMIRSDGNRVGRYKQNLTENYWRMSSDVDEPTCPMTADKQAVLEHINKIFQQMTDKCTKPTQQIPTQDGHTWQQIQIRIIRNTSAGVQFASQIPGFNRLHPEDKAFLCKSVTFMSSVLMAGQYLYNPKDKNFEDFWNWQISPQNPFYAFKECLVNLGDKIHATQMDVYEVSALAALLFLASDFSDLVYTEAIEEARRKIVSALKSYLLSKGVDVKSRLSELFHLVPEIRHVGVWHQQLMGQMKINVQKQEVQQLYEAVNYRES
ncbi:hypothetical protein ACF0H5_002150 [Mactra antiquata]